MLKTSNKPTSILFFPGWDIIRYEVASGLRPTEGDERDKPSASSKVTWRVWVDPAKWGDGSSIFLWILKPIKSAVRFQDFVHFVLFWIPRVLSVFFFFCMQNKESVENTESAQSARPRLFWKNMGFGHQTFDFSGYRSSVCLGSPFFFPEKDGTVIVAWLTVNRWHSAFTRVFQELRKHVWVDLQQMHLQKALNPTVLELDSSAGGWFDPKTFHDCLIPQGWNSDIFQLFFWAFDRQGRRKPPFSLSAANGQAEHSVLPDVEAVRVESVVIRWWWGLWLPKSLVLGLHLTRTSHRLGFLLESCFVQWLASG